MSEQTTKPTETKSKFTVPLSDLKVGALWKKKNEASGEVKLSLQITLGGKTYNLMAYKNRFKTEDGKNSPDYKIYLNEKDFLALKGAGGENAVKAETPPSSDCEL